MKYSRRIVIVFALLLTVPAILPAQAQQTAQEISKPALPNYVELSARIGTGGQPGDGGMKQLADKGYKAVVNIRASSEGADLAVEEKQAIDLGLRYYMVPFSAKEPSDEQALAFGTLMSALKDQKVFVHCGSGNRVGSLMMVYLVLEEGMPLDQAEQAARKIGLRSPDLVDFARRVINSHKK